MGQNDDSKSYQLRVRITAEERNLLDAMRLKRNRGETLSDLVREAIALLVKPHGTTGAQDLRPPIRANVQRLAELLQRQPRQVEESCIEGILDLIEHKCEVPLIVMETQLHLKYRGKSDKADYPWNAAPAEIQPDPAPVEPAA
jgi:hypothetical protein